MKNLILFVITFLGISSLSAQTNVMKIANRQSVQLVKKQIDRELELFNPSFSDRKDSAIELVLDQNVLTSIWEKEPDSLSINLPLPNGSTEVFKFTKTQISNGEFTVTTNDGKKLTGKDYLGIHYQLMREGKKHLGGLSFRKDGLMGMISHQNGNYNLGEISPGRGIYVISDDSKVAFPGFDCATPDTKGDIGGHGKELPIQNKSASSLTCKPVKVAFEADFDLYTRSGNNISTATNFITGLFNIVKQVFENEQITLQIGGVFVWTSVDPYASLTNSFTILNTFANNRPVAGINGDLLHFLDCRTSSLGGIAYIGALCNPITRHGFSSIFYSYQSLPTFSWSVFCISHELGHNFGSRHTHWCGWTLPGGGTGRIDSCSAGEGTCGSNTKATKGTIMSYCYNTTGGVDMNLGFGPLPGKAIRDGLSAATCISGSCLATAALKVDSAVNFDKHFTLNIAIPANSGATNWQIKEGATIVLSGALANQNAVNIDVPVANRLNGTYSFTATLTAGANTSTSSTITVSVSNTTVTFIFNPGTLTAGNQTICNGGDPTNINFSSLSSTGSSFQWYVQNGLVSAPGNTAGTTGWTLISGAILSNYNPPANQTSNQTFACRVSNGSSSEWAAGVRQVTVLPVFNPGIVSSGDETFCTSGNPANITLSNNPTGSGAYQFRWYFRETATGNCPSGGTILGGWNTNSSSPNIFGTSSDGSGINFDPIGAGALNSGRTFALYITPIANGSIPACGVPQWANNCRKTIVVSCQANSFSPGTISDQNQIICNGGDAAGISFSIDPTLGSTYQWYAQNGLVAAPTNTASLVGWTAISGAISSIYDPVSGFTSSQTFACRTTNGVNSQWATGVRQITVLDPFNPGSLISNQSGCTGYDPIQITMASTPTGSGSYSWKWFYWDNTTQVCPGGNTIPAGAISSTSDTRFFGTSATGAGIGFDASSAGTNGRTWAVLVTPIANGTTPACGTPQFATTCHRTLLAACRMVGSSLQEVDLTDNQSIHLEQNFPNPWKDETKIPYFLPEGTQNAKLVVYNKEGKMVYEEVVNGSGTGEIVLKQKNFSSGIYLYTCIVDGGVRTKPIRFSVL